LPRDAVRQKLRGFHDGSYFVRKNWKIR
jgi:hypothetical protein